MIKLFVRWNQNYCKMPLKMLLKGWTLWSCNIRYYFSYINDIADTVIVNKNFCQIKKPRNSKDPIKIYIIGLRKNCFLTRRLGYPKVTYICIIHHIHTDPLLYHIKPNILLKTPNGFFAIVSPEKHSAVVSLIKKYQTFGSLSRHTHVRIVLWP